METVGHMVDLMEIVAHTGVTDRTAVMTVVGMIQVLALVVAAEGDERATPVVDQVYLTVIPFPHYLVRPLSRSGLFP